MTTSHSDAGAGGQPAPTGRQVTIRAGAYEAVLTEVGAGLRQLTYGGRHLVLGFDEHEIVSGCRGQLLVPWPNRVDHGRYEVDGQVRQLDVSEPARDTAIHGLTRWDTWSADDEAADRIRWCYRLHARPGYPHVLDLEVTYALEAEAGLVVTLHARNVGAERAPWGFGTHPYLRGADHVDDSRLELGAHRVVLTDERGIPTEVVDVTGTTYDLRGGATLAGRVIDHAFTELDRSPGGRVTARLVDASTGVGAELWGDESCSYMQVYTGDRLRPTARVAVAVEPMSCAPNAYVTGEGLVWLEPGEDITHTFGISAIG